ncbi:MAG: ABC transporter substrate-binding protein [candidate division NC10 bacterium]|nr:ABC transporter substrate-binding protein [candidate division NC10 bacterium]
MKGIRARGILMEGRLGRWVAICLSGLILLWEGCPLASAHAQEQIRVTDFRGRQLVFLQPAQRIVCLIESALTGLYMLGAQDRVVGISTNIYQGGGFPYYASMDDRIRRRRLPTPGNWDFVNIESVIALKPDLVIIWAKQSESIAVLEERGIPVFGVFLKRKEDVYEEILALGKLTGTEKRAAELVRYTREEIGRFEKRVADIPLHKRPGVYYMWAQGNLETSGAGSTVDDLIRLAGGRNVCASLGQEHTVVSLEQVLSWNPEVVLMWYNERKDPSHILNDPQWRTIKAVRDKRVHEFPEVFLCDLWTLKFQYAVKMVAKWCHPLVFEDVDLEMEKRKMLHRLYGDKIGRLLN